MFMLCMCLMKWGLILTLYNQLFKIYHTTTNKDIKEKAELLLHQFYYGCFDTAYKKELTNFIGEYINVRNK